MTDAEVIERLGHKIRQEREKRDWTLVAFAEKAKTTPSSVSRIENGKQWPRPATLSRLCDTLDLDPVYVLAVAFEP